MYVLHYAPDNASLIVRLVLLELGLPFTTQLVDRAAQAQASAAYRALVPTGLIPALQRGDEVMFETGAILLHLADSAGRMMPPAGDAQRPDALKWLFFIANTLHTDCRLHFYPARYAGQTPAPEAFSTATRVRLAGHLGLINRAAESKPALFWADGPTILALYTVVICRWLQLYPTDQAKWLNLANWPAIYDLTLRCERRASAREAARAEGLGADIFSAPSLPNPPEGSAT
jgi:glutathione S-transferase